MCEVERERTVLLVADDWFPFSPHLMLRRALWRSPSRLTLFLDATRLPTAYERRWRNNPLFSWVSVSLLLIFSLSLSLSLWHWRIPRWLPRPRCARTRIEWRGPLRRSITFYWFPSLAHLGLSLSQTGMEARCWRMCVCVDLICLVLMCAADRVQHSWFPMCTMVEDQEVCR